MKSKLFNRMTLFLIFLMIVFTVRADKEHSSGIGVHLMSLYEYPVKGYEKYGKINRIRYKNDFYDPVNYPDHGIKFVVHQNGVKVKVEQVEEVIATESPVQESEPELSDDLELVAVITAAIAAYTGNSTDGLVVRSIKRVSKKRR